MDVTRFCVKNTISGLVAAKFDDRFQAEDWIRGMVETYGHAATDFCIIAYNARERL